MSRKKIKIRMNCRADNCIFNQKGLCQIKPSIDENYECELFFDYRGSLEYQEEHWKAILKDGKKYKVRSFGRRAEKDGIVFYYYDKELTKSSLCTEEYTGRSFHYLKIRYIKKTHIVSYEAVESLPELDEEENNGKET